MKEYTIGWEQPCKGCGHHDSMWKSLVTSKEWKAWCAKQNLQFNVDEAQELGIMSAAHFKAFIKFVKKL